MEITSISMNKDITTVTYTVAEGTATEERTRKDPAMPAPEFQQSFKSMQTLANEILNGLLKSEAIKNIRPSKVSFHKHKENGSIGCIISLTAEIENSTRPFNFNTPLKYTLTEGKDETEFCLSGKSVDIITDLIGHATDWMNGKRAQGDMFNQDEPKKEKFAGKPIKEVTQGEEAQRIIEGKKPKLRKNRKTCFDCTRPSAMIIEGVGYCEEHGKARLVPE